MLIWFKKFDKQWNFFYNLGIYISVSCTTQQKESEVGQKSVKRFLPETKNGKWIKAAYTAEIQKQQRDKPSNRYVHSLCVHGDI